MVLAGLGALPLSAPGDAAGLDPTVAAGLAAGAALLAGLMALLGASLDARASGGPAWLSAFLLTVAAIIAALVVGVQTAVNADGWAWLFGLAYAPLLGGAAWLAAARLSAGPPRGPAGTRSSR
jgi:hypothetical protein